MFLWVFAAILFFISIYLLAPFIYPYTKFGFKKSNEIEVFKKLVNILGDLEASLQNGVLPSESDWNKLGDLGEWGLWVKKNIMDIRERGLEIIPSVNRFKKFFSDQHKMQLNAISKSAQSFVSALLSAFLLPILSATIYFLSPEVSKFTSIWIFLTMVFFIWNFMGVLWIIRITNVARWGGINNQKHQRWIIEVPMFIQKLISSINAGEPLDLAWHSSCKDLSIRQKELAYSWGSELWGEGVKNINTYDSHSKEIFQLGLNLKRTLQASLVEGVSVIDRIDQISSTLGSLTESSIERELNLIQTRSLKPLFLFIAPSCIGLLISAGFIFTFSTKDFFSL